MATQLPTKDHEMNTNEMEALEELLQAARCWQRDSPGDCYGLRPDRTDWAIAVVKSMVFNIALDNARCQNSTV
jgi:hypothetical protein